MQHIHTLCCSLLWRKEHTGRASCAMLCRKIVQRLNCIMDEAEHYFKQNVFTCKLLLSNEVRSDMLLSSWVALHMALIYRILSASLLPGSAKCTGPICFLNNFLPGVSAGGAQLHDGGTSPRRKAQASDPCASFCLASLGISSNSWWRSAPSSADRWGSTLWVGNSRSFIVVYMLWLS